MPESEAFIVVDFEHTVDQPDGYYEFPVDPAQVKGFDVGDSVTVVDEDATASGEGVLTVSSGLLVVRVHRGAITSLEDPVEPEAPTEPEGPEAGPHWTQVRGTDESEYLQNRSR